MWMGAWYVKRKQCRHIETPRTPLGGIQTVCLGQVKGYNNQGLM